jgi:hypothetical protein
LSHRRLEVPRLGRGHLVLREVEDLLGQQAENCHVVFTDGKAGVARLNDLVDECGPVVWPLLLQNRDQDQIQFVQESAFAAEFLLGAGVLDDEIDDEVADAYGRAPMVSTSSSSSQSFHWERQEWLYSTLTLISRQHLPSSHNHIVEDLEGNVWDMVSQSLPGKGREFPARTFRLGV